MAHFALLIHTSGPLCFVDSYQWPTLLCWITPVAHFALLIHTSGPLCFVDSYQWPTLLCWFILVAHFALLIHTSGLLCFVDSYQWPTLLCWITPVAYFALLNHTSGPLCFVESHQWPTLPCWITPVTHFALLNHTSDLKSVFQWLPWQAPHIIIIVIIIIIALLHCIERRDLRLVTISLLRHELSPNTYTQMAQSCADHVQHIKCLSRKKCSVPLAKKGQLSYSVWQSWNHIYSSFILLAETINQWRRGGNRSTQSIGSVLEQVDPCQYSVTGWASKLICNLYLSVAACTIVRADPSLRYTSHVAGTLTNEET